MMDHREYKRIVPGARIAVLFLHGIVSTPRHFDPFLPMVPEDVSVWALLLDGHGMGVQEFGRSSMAKWEAQVQEAVEELSHSHDRLYLVAHSMGTLFSFCHAVKNEKIAGLFLLASPLKVFVRFKMLSTAFRLYFDLVKPEDEVTQAMRNSLSDTVSRNPFHYIRWISRFLELFSMIRRTRKELRKLTTPTVVCQSKKDELVSTRSVKYLKSNPHIRIFMLKNSMHTYYEKKDMEIVKQEFQKFINSMDVSPT